MFRSYSKLLKTFIGHTDRVRSVDYVTFDGGQFICSGSDDKTVRLWDVENNKQIQLFKGHPGYVYCVKFSLYHYHNRHRNVISSSGDKTIRFWDIKDNAQLQMFNGGASEFCGIEFSSFNGGRYLCSGTYDNTIHLWDVETSNLLHIFNGHEGIVWCVDFSPSQSNNNHNENKSNNIGVIGGNGYTICSGAGDKTIRTWDIETTKQLTVFTGHRDFMRSVKYGSNELRNTGGANTILSGSQDRSVRLWDIRSGQQIQAFSGHRDWIYAVEYSPFVIKNSEFGDSSNVVCSGSQDNTIRFWDVRSNKEELHVIKGDEKNDGILCLKSMVLKTKEKNSKNTKNSTYDLNLCYGSRNGPICIWG
ncbi:WD-40 repeat protein [Reticulomyxa filosa]|uniref:WD-40 repeat protein n=1 Tax=Reticulomyxa filosa TaxID=46433 RepID=X6LKN8_RETFI|nr:WD-40 repeat protein [Reticulomyxa filosa]|eukprot:ETO02194.1 WD-40 repeat protein [Reticulomyxa filosa]